MMKKEVSVTTPYGKSAEGTTGPYKTRSVPEPLIPSYAHDEGRAAIIYSEVAAVAERYSAADVAFVCDITGSMGLHIKLVRNTLKSIIAAAKPILTSLPRFAFIGFRDKKDAVQTVKHDFTTNVEEMEKFIMDIKCDGGGDTCEDITTPMKEALSLQWRSDLMLVYLVVDAPTHGMSYHDADDSDDYIEEDKERLLEKLCAHYSQVARVNLIVLKCNNTVDKMVRIMSTYYYTPDHRLAVVNVSIGQKELNSVLEDTLKKRISDSFSRTLMHNFRKIKPVGGPVRCGWQILNVPVAVECSIYSGSFKLAPDFEKEFFRFEVAINRTASKQRFSISTAPIAAGTFKQCYPLAASSGDAKYVAKIPMAPVDSVEKLKTDIEGSVFASYFTVMFNTLLGENAFATLSLVVMELTDGSEKQDLFRNSKFFVAQSFLEGLYVKYNNNYGWVAKEKDRWNDLAQAFSHFTYEASRGTVLIVDIQGVIIPRGGQSTLVMTDPAIHSALYKNHFMEGSHGKMGIIRFFETHECNGICKRLMLTNTKEYLGDKPKLEEEKKLRNDLASHKDGAKLKEAYSGFEEEFAKAAEIMRKIDLVLMPNPIAEIPEVSETDESSSAGDGF